jgi:predicted tellurium resistance membrane protein TerC
MDWITSPEAWIALLTLTVLEIVLGIDNVIFISILAGKLPREQQGTARTVGLALAMLMRIVLLFSLTWIMRLTAPLFAVLGEEISGRDLVLIVGGLFLLYKATHEIHDRLEGEEGEESVRVRPSLTSVLIQIMLLDIVFSLDSVITAVGMAEDLGVMVTAVVIAVGFMMVFAAPVSRFVERHNPHCRWSRPPHTEGLHLFRDGVLDRRRAAESAGAAGKAGRRQAAATIRGATREGLRALDLPRVIHATIPVDPVRSAPRCVR